MYTPQETTQQYLTRFEGYVDECKANDIEATKMKAIVANIKARIKMNNSKNEITSVKWSFNEETNQFESEIELVIDGKPLGWLAAYCPEQVAGHTSERIVHDLIEKAVEHVKVKYFFVIDTDNIKIEDTTKILNP